MLTHYIFTPALIVGMLVTIAAAADSPPLNASCHDCFHMIVPGFEDLETASTFFSIVQLSSMPNINTPPTSLPFYGIPTSVTVNTRASGSQLTTTKQPSISEMPSSITSTNPDIVSSSRSALRNNTTTGKLLVQASVLGLSVVHWHSHERTLIQL
ncbi:hypothetical protein C8Q70DRAFT_1123638 [Cubamyces menziesii]|nr:hypothetical protein C8Q70DRAFT_1123638 [Cubamyces menziesii]